MGCELGLGDELGLKKGTVERIVRELLVSSVLYASTAEALQGLSRPTPARGRGRQVECSPLRKTFSYTSSCSLSCDRTIALQAIC